MKQGGLARKKGGIWFKEGMAPIKITKSIAYTQQYKEAARLAKGFNRKYENLWLSSSESPYNDWKCKSEGWADCHTGLLSNKYFDIKFYFTDTRTCLGRVEWNIQAKTQDNNDSKELISNLVRVANNHELQQAQVCKMNHSQRVRYYDENTYSMSRPGDRLNDPAIRLVFDDSELWFGMYDNTYWSRFELYTSDENKFSFVYLGTTPEHEYKKELIQQERFVDMLTYCAFYRGKFNPAIDIAQLPPDKRIN